MPRVLINNNNTKTTLSTKTTTNTSTTTMTTFQLNKLLRRNRSKAYVDKMCNLDAGGQICNHHTIDSLVEAVKQELPEVTIDKLPKGLVAKCYIGDSYHVHTLDFVGKIIHHYKSFEKLPHELEKARTLAMNTNYAFIEVYDDCMRVVSKNGQVSVV